VTSHFLLAIFDQVTNKSIVPKTAAWKAAATAARCIAVAHTTMLMPAICAAHQRSTPAPPSTKPPEPNLKGPSRGRVCRERLRYLLANARASWLTASLCFSFRISAKLRAISSWTELQHPAPHRFVGDVEAALGQQFFDIAVAQGKAEIEPDPGFRRLKKGRGDRCGSIACTSALAIRMTRPGSANAAASGSPPQAVSRIPRLRPF
jgi:hypothetical protein